MEELIEILIKDVSKARRLLGDKAEIRGMERASCCPKKVKKNKHFSTPSHLRTAWKEGIGKRYYFVWMWCEEAYNFNPMKEKDTPLRAVAFWKYVEMMKTAIPVVRRLWVRKSKVEVHCLSLEEAEAYVNLWLLAYPKRTYYIRMPGGPRVYRHQTCPGLPKGQQKLY